MRTDPALRSAPHDPPAGTRSAPGAPARKAPPFGRGAPFGRCGLIRPYRLRRDERPEFTVASHGFSGARPAEGGAPVCRRARPGPGGAHGRPREAAIRIEAAILRERRGLPFSPARPAR